MSSTGAGDHQPGEIVPLDKRPQAGWEAPGPGFVAPPRQQPVPQQSFQQPWAQQAGQPATHPGPAGQLHPGQPVQPYRGQALQPYVGPPQGSAGYGYGPAQQYPPVGYGFALKESGIAYLLWFFLGGFGAHHFYLGRIGWGVAYLIATIVGAATAWIIVGVPLLLAVGIGWLVDAFLIPSYVRETNARATGLVRPPY